MPYRSTFSVGVHSVETGAAVQIGQRAMGRGSVLIQNLDAANPIFIGPDNGVTAGNGFRIGPGDSVELDETNGDIWAISTGGTVDTRVLTS